MKPSSMGPFRFDAGVTRAVLGRPARFSVDGADECRIANSRSHRHRALANAVCSCAEEPT